MTLQTIRDNLRNTINDKEYYLDSLEKEYITSVGVDRAVLYSVKAFLEINIHELKCIVADVNEVINDQENDRIERDLNT